jgi:hypothetical protein
MKKFCGRLAIVAAIALSNMTAAQTSASKKNNTDLSLKNATQPLMPKSEITPKKSSSAGLPVSNRNTGKELTKLEQQKFPTAKPNQSASKPVKFPTDKPAPANGGSGINASYQKPRIPK